MRQNDFVYNPRKSSDAPYGPISSYKYAEDGIVSPLYLCFHAKGEINPLYYEWYFRSSAWHRYIYMSGDSGARHDRVSIKDDTFFAMPINLPSEQEQSKIASFLQSLDERIAAQEKLVASLKKYKRGLLHDVLSEKIKITTETWTEHRIGEFLHSKSIKQLPTTDAPLMAFTATGGVCDKGERYDRGFLVKDASSKLYKRTDLNDFIYSSNNLDVGSIGLNLYGSAVISDVYEIFSIKDADPWFISEAIKQKPIMSRILKYRQGCLYGQYRIYAEDFLGVFVKIPSYEAQKKIGAVFSKIDGKITQEQILLDCLEKARTFFLQQLFI
ncbi:restriction endonuclease subunit S [Faecousia intestinalis]|uniref:restriction endonuclease subunit S n=1 Tax=Faecousia intestinalis TaxID=3133167 RepID=UPI003F49B18C